MTEILAALSRAVEGSPVGALSAAFAWGLISVLLSPCHLASIPLIVGFSSEQKGLTVGRAFRTAPLFAAGLFTAFGLGHCTVITAAGTSVKRVHACRPARLRPARARRRALFPVHGPLMTSCPPRVRCGGSGDRT